jgi:hypothetical protein
VYDIVIPYGAENKLFYFYLFYLFYFYKARFHPFGILQYLSVIRNPGVLLNQEYVELLESRVPHWYLSPGLSVVCNPEVLPNQKVVELLARWVPRCYLSNCVACCP